MPYRIKGKNLEHKKGGKWSIKQKCSSVANAKSAMRLLNAVEHTSWRPTGIKGKKKGNK